MVGKILYHGSNMKVDKPMLLKGQRALDFISRHHTNRQ